MKKGAKTLTDFKKFLDFVFFSLGLSNFWLGAWFPFDEGQFNPQSSNLIQTLSFTAQFEIDFDKKLYYSEVTKLPLKPLHRMLPTSLSSDKSRAENMHFFRKFLYALFLVCTIAEVFTDFQLQIVLCTCVRY